MKNVESKCAMPFCHVLQGIQVIQPELAAYHARLGKLLRTIRRVKDVTQKELAEKLGRGQPFVARYEAGDRTLDAVELVLVSRALGVAPTKVVRRLERMMFPEAGQA
jgi:hypothetical protein